MSVMAFYEKVIKVKADVAAFLINCFPFHLSHRHHPPVVTWGAVKGAPEQGAFIWTLDSSPRHLQSSRERSATQFRWASFLSGFGFQFVLARLSAMLPNCLPRSFPFVPRVIGAS